MERADYERWSAKDVARLLALVETGRRYYQEIVAAAPVGLLVVSNDLSIVMANRRFREMFDLRGQDLSKRTLEEVLPIEGLRKRIMDVLTSGESQRGIDFVLPAEEGPARPLKLDLQFQETWEDEKEAEVLVFIQEVLIEERTTPVITQAPLPEVPAVLWEADPEQLQYTFVSDAAESLLGLPREKWLAEPGMYPERIHPEDRAWVLGLYRATVQDRTGRNCEYRAVAANGTTLWLREMIHPVLDAEGRVVKLSGVTFDNTDHRRLYEQAGQAQKMDALTRLASRVGHDFNNLLMIVAGYGEELLNGLSPKDPLRIEVEEILNATDRVSRLTNQLLSFSRRLAARPQPVELTKLLSDLAPRLRAAMPAGVRLQTILRSGAVQVEADPNLIEQAVSDLAGSAQSLMTEGRLTIESSTVDLLEYGCSGAGLTPGRYAEIVIHSAGGTFDEETRSRLFEPFAGPREFGKEPGLGLANTYRIIKQAGGDLWVSSEPGRGTAMRIYLPVLEKQEEPEVAGEASTATEVVAPPPAPIQETAPEGIRETAPELPPEPESAAAAHETVPAEPQPAIEAAAPPPPPVAAVAGAPETVAAQSALPRPEAAGEAPKQPSVRVRETVMVVEDEEGVRALMQKILRRQGYRVIEAANGAEALEIAKGHEEAIHLLVTDVVMPQMGGRALADQLKTVRPEIKVLYVSGFTDDAVIQSGLLPPGTAFLQKPFTLNSLLTKVREVLSGAFDGPAPVQ